MLSCKRIVSKQGAPSQGLDFFGGTPLRGADADAAADWEADHPGARIVALADLWLDRPDTLDALSRVLSGAPQRGSLEREADSPICRVLTRHKEQASRPACMTWGIAVLCALASAITDRLL